MKTETPFSVSEVASLVSLQPRTAGWSALLVAPERIAPIAAELAEELGLEGVEAQPMEAPEASSLAASLAEHRASVVVIHGLDGYQETDWRTLDVARSQMERRWATILVLGAEALGGLVRGAPHLASWLRHTWVLDEHAGELTAEEREGRLRALREWAKKSDQEVIDLATRWELPGEPPYAEWLVLLGRGDLLGSGR